MQKNDQFQQPSVTETVQKFEESTRTEEVERRVSSRQKEKKHRREHRSSRHRHRDQGMIGGGGGDYPPWTSPMGNLHSCLLHFRQQKSRD